jgi:hypothetical protein
VELLGVAMIATAVACVNRENRCGAVWRCHDTIISFLGIIHRSVFI